MNANQKEVKSKPIDTIAIPSNTLTELLYEIEDARGRLDEMESSLFYINEEVRNWLNTETITYK